jgi:hypothetical protein
MKVTSIKPPGDFVNDLFLDGLCQTSNQQLGLVTVSYRKSGLPGKAGKPKYQYALYPGPNETFNAMRTKNDMPWETFAVIEAEGHEYVEVWDAFISLLRNHEYI